MGLAASNPSDARRQPGGRVLGVRGQLPALTYRYGTEPVGRADFTVRFRLAENVLNKLTG